MLISSGAATCAAAPVHSITSFDFEGTSASPRRYLPFFPVPTILYGSTREPVGVVTLYNGAAAVGGGLVGVVMVGAAERDHGPAAVLFAEDETDAILVHREGVHPARLIAAEPRAHRLLRGEVLRRTEKVVTRLGRCLGFRDCRG